jgi:nicotinamidase-related amidase
MNLNPEKTAVVLIEFQNDFTSEGGTLHDAVKGVMDDTNMLANAVDTAEKARDMGVTVIHVPISFAEGYNEITKHPYGILKGVVDTNSFRKGTWGVEIVDDLKPQPSDIIVEGKRGLDTFASTNLDFILRSRGIENIAIGGFLTNCCVESTMRTGYENGYNVITLTDCVAATSAEEHTNAIEKDFPMFSRPMSHDDFLGLLSGEAAVADTSRGYTD